MLVLPQKLIRNKTTDDGLRPPMLRNDRSGLRLVGFVRHCYVEDEMQMTLKEHASHIMIDQRLYLYLHP